MIAVMMIMGLVTAAVAMSMEDDPETIRAVASTRDQEMVTAGVEFGVAYAIDQLAHRPAAYFENLGSSHDIFGGSPGAGGCASSGTDCALFSIDFPLAGPDQGQYRIRIGFRPTQRGRPPAGTDVRTAYGQIIEFQISVENQSSSNPIGEQVSVGYLIPRENRHG